MLSLPKMTWWMMKIWNGWKTTRTNRNGLPPLLWRKNGKRGAGKKKVWKK